MICLRWCQRRTRKTCRFDSDFNQQTYQNPAPFKGHSLRRIIQSKVLASVMANKLPTRGRSGSPVRPFLANEELKTLVLWGRQLGRPQQVVTKRPRLCRVFGRHQRVRIGRDGSWQSCPWRGPLWLQDISTEVSHKKYKRDFLKE